MADLKLFVTLWPSFPHFLEFADDERIAGIRLNSAMMSQTELEQELAIASAQADVPLWFDVKGRQLRIAEVLPNEDHLDIRLNHPIRVPTPSDVLFKAGADGAQLHHLEEDGLRLVFVGGPHYKVREGESLHVRDPALEVLGPIFTAQELAKIERVKKAGIKRWFLSYVEEQRDVDLFRELIGTDAQIMLKIESRRGLEYVAKDFEKSDGITLVAARGDLYVEVDRPHDVLKATKLVLEKDPQACVASRLLLSCINGPVPECVDFSELAWLYDIGYRNMMLCDELCLKGNLLARAMNVFEAFRREYAN
ncbi:MAG: pyruvate kinase [Patescibacteria group bacterium]|nr:pyruvate kinase [Patescibacteria group bacterium]